MNHNPGEEFLQAMAEELVKPEKLKDAVAQNVANALWSFATLGAPPPAQRRLLCDAPSSATLWRPCSYQIMGQPASTG